MSQRSTGGRGARSAELEAVLPDLRKLSRIHGVVGDLLEDSHDLHELVDRTLAELSRRSAGSGDGGGPAAQGDHEFGALLNFAREAHALHERSNADDAERQRAHALRRLDARLQRALQSRDPSLRQGMEQIAETMRQVSNLTHKINNPLTSLLGRIQILRLRRETDPAVLKAVEVVEESAHRVAELVRDLARTAQQGREDVLQGLLELERAEPEEDALTP